MDVADIDRVQDPDHQSIEEKNHQNFQHLEKLRDLDHLGMMCLFDLTLIYLKMDSS